MGRKKKRWRQWVSVEQCCVESWTEFESYMLSQRVSVEQCCVERANGEILRVLFRGSFRRTVLCGKLLTPYWFLLSIERVSVEQCCVESWFPLEECFYYGYPRFRRTVLCGKLILLLRGPRHEPGVSVEQCCVERCRGEGRMGLSFMVSVEQCCVESV